MRFFLAVFTPLFVVLSPLVLYFSATRLTVGYAALVVAGWIALRVLGKVLSTPRGQRLAAVQLPLLGIGCALLGGLVRDPRLLLVLPGVMQLAFAGTFLGSLRKGSAMPLVERFARMEEPVLTSEKIAYCRNVTKIWGGFLSILGTASLLAAVLLSRGAWAIFTGIVSYALVASLFAAEYLIRQYRFRSDRKNVIQRFFFRHFSPSLAAESSKPG